MNDKAEIGTSDLFAARRRGIRVPNATVGRLQARPSEGTPVPGELLDPLHHLRNKVTGEAFFVTPKRGVPEEEQVLRFSERPEERPEGGGIVAQRRTEDLLEEEAMVSRHASPEGDPRPRMLVLRMREDP